jgi:hypothetical protein
MPLEHALHVVATGDVDAERLRLLREALGLAPTGRLADPDDAEFGYRDLTPRGAPGWVTLSLWRHADRTWGVDLAYLDLPPDGELVESVRDRVRSALGQVGLDVAHEWPSPERGSE